MTVRDIAFRSLFRYEISGSYPNIELDSAIEKSGLSGRDRALLTALVYGTVEKKITLDYIISKLSDRDIEKIDKDILVILRMGVYQILYMDGIPDHAACNECVDLCFSRNKKSASGFVNALLRETARRRDGFEFPKKEDSPITYLSVNYSFPEWICSMWTKDFGFDKCEKIMSSMSVNRNPVFRVNTLKTDVGYVIGQLRENGVSAEKGIFAKDAVRLTEPYPVKSLELLKNGYVFVQDESSQICAELLGALPGENVIDTCACPGGKSFSVSIDMKNQGKVFSFDLHGNKLSLVKKGAERLGIDIIETREKDGRVFSGEFAAFADRVLVDAPCSGLGVISKKPDLRYKEKESVERLPDVQYQILDNSSGYVKDGGTLIYSTCTLNRRENEEVALRFLSSHPEFVPLDFDLSNGIKSEKGMFTFFPDENGTDGFFVSRFLKKTT